MYLKYGSRNWPDDDTFMIENKISCVLSEPALKYLVKTHWDGSN